MANTRLEKNLLPERSATQGITTKKCLNIAGALSAVMFVLETALGRLVVWRGGP